MSRREANRALAAWLRDQGVNPVGQAWDAARKGERDLAELSRLNLADGWGKGDGLTRAAKVARGDFLPDYGARVHYAVTDPETGEIVLDVTRDQDGTPVRGELVLTATERVRVHRKREAPAWVREATEAYRSARDAWEAGRESGNVAPTSVPGTSGSGVAMYQLTRAEYAEHVPAPRLATFLAEYAAARRDVGETVDA